MENEPDADSWLEDTRTSYDAVAASYADQVRDLLDETPVERAVLALFADLVSSRGGGPVADVGCGPGRITAHLRQLGVDAFGIDLSPGMIEMVMGWLNEAGFTVDEHRTLTSAGSALGGILLARRQPDR